jgi:hypothetical protein
MSDVVPVKIDRSRLSFCHLESRPETTKHLPVYRSGKTMRRGIGVEVFGKTGVL